MRFYVVNYAISVTWMIWRHSIRMNVHIERKWLWWKVDNSRSFTTFFHSSSVRGCSTEGLNWRQREENRKFSVKRSKLIFWHSENTIISYTIAFVLFCLSRLEAGKFSSKNAWLNEEKRFIWTKWQKSRLVRAIFSPNCNISWSAVENA